MPLGIIDVGFQCAKYSVNQVKKQQKSGAKENPSESVNGKASNDFFETLLKLRLNKEWTQKKVYVCFFFNYFLFFIVDLTGSERDSWIATILKWLASHNTSGNYSSFSSK